MLAGMESRHCAARAVGIAPFRRDIVFAACSLCAALAHAQPVPTPGAVLDTVPERRTPSISTPAEVLFPQERSGPRRPETRRFLVSGFTFTGNTVVAEPLLRRLLERYLDLELTLAELDRVADVITAHYRSLGFTVARAFIPAQRVDDGLVTIQIIEGTIDSVVFKGRGRYDGKFLGPYLAPLTQGPEKPLVTDELLERQLLVLNDLPGLKARATLIPGREFGTTSVEVDTEEKFVGVSLGVMNSGTRETGRNRADAGITLNNPLRIGDQASLRAMRSSDNLFRYYRLGYSLPVGSKGLRLAFSGVATDYELGGAFSALQIAGRVRSVDATLSYPFIRSRAKNVIGAVQWRQTNTEQTVFGLPFSEAKLPLVVGSVYANWVGDDSSATALSAALSTNLVSKGSSSVTGTNASFAKIDTELTYLTGAARNWDFFFRGRGVYGTHTLPDTEKFSIGGYDSVRGYPSATVRGDEGYQFTAEVRRQIMVADTPGYLAMFADIGGVQNKGFIGWDRLSSVGVGWTHYLGGKGQVKAEYAKPMIKVAGRDNKSMVWVSMSVAF